MPLFAVWAGTSLLYRQQGSAWKSRNLEAEPRCVISTDTGDLHVIVEGIAHHVRDQATLEKAVRAFEAIYGWPTRVDGSHLDADYGAPTSGGPPYEVYEVTPAKAFALLPLMVRPRHRRAGLAAARMIRNASVRRWRVRRGAPDRWAYAVSREGWRAGGVDEVDAVVG